MTSTGAQPPPLPLPPPQGSNIGVGTLEFQEIKFTRHRRLLDRINLEALSSIVGDRARVEIRSAVARLVEEENPPLNLVEKERLIEEVLDEVFGLGPLERH